MTRKRSRTNGPDPITQEVNALLSGVEFSLPKEEDEETHDDATAHPAATPKDDREAKNKIEPSLVEGVLADADFSLPSDSPKQEVALQPSSPTPKPDQQVVDDFLKEMDFTPPQAPALPDTASPVEDLLSDMSFEQPTASSEVVQQEEKKVEPQDDAPSEQPPLEVIEEEKPIHWSFDLSDNDRYGDDEEYTGPIFDLSEDGDTDQGTPTEEPELLSPEASEAPEVHPTVDNSADAERRRQALIKRLVKRFGPDVEQEIKNASEVLTTESMQNLLLQYWAEDQEFKAEDEIRLAQERLNKKSWKQKITESKKFGPIGSAILGAGLGIAGSVAARSGANILIKKALMNRVHHGLGEATAFITGGTFGAIKGYLHEKERRRDARQLLADLQQAGRYKIDSVSKLQILNEAIKDGLKGDQETMKQIFDKQSELRFSAINEHQLGELAEHALKQVEQGKGANEIILDNLVELLDRKANLEFRESKNKFKKIYDRGWQQMAKKMGKGFLAGGITSLLAYEVAHWVADKIGDVVGDWWAKHHGGTATPPAVPAPEHAPTPSHPTTPEATPSHPPIAETPATQTPPAPPTTEPTIPDQPTPEAPLIPESPHHITNPTDYARELTIQDQSFQDMVYKFADGQISGKNGADWILNHHGVMANYQIPELNGATLSDQLREFIQANHDKLKDPETAQAVYRAVYNAASHPTILVDYQTGHLSPEVLASDWHHLTKSFSESRGEIVNDVNKFIASQHQLWNGAHLPKDIAEEFTKIQPPVVDAASFGITAPDAAASVTSASASSVPSSPPSPLSSSSPASSPVSFWQSPVGNGLKALGIMGGGAGIAGAILYGLDKKDSRKKEVDQSEKSDEAGKKAEEEKKKPTTSKSEEAKQKSAPVEAEIAYNQPKTIEEFVKFVQEDLEQRLQDLPVNSVIMELITSESKPRANIELSTQAIQINLGNLRESLFRTDNLGFIDVGQSRKIWLSSGESKTVYEVGGHIGVRDVDNPSQKPDFSKPGQFEFYYIK